MNVQVSGDVKIEGHSLRFFSPFMTKFQCQRQYET